MKGKKREEYLRYHRQVDWDAEVESLRKIITAIPYGEPRVLDVHPSDEGVVREALRRIQPELSDGVQLRVPGKR